MLLIGKLSVYIWICGDLPVGKTMERVNTSDAKLYNSSFSGDIEGVIAALAQGGKVTMRCPNGFTPLAAAAQNGHADICGLLLAYGSNVNETDPGPRHTALHFATNRGHSSY